MSLQFQVRSAFETSPFGKFCASTRPSEKTVKRSPTRSATPAANIRSGEKITVRVKLRFREPVENAVAGILIRTRIGVSVYGTNTELEQTPIGPRRRDELVEVDFEFPCNLCPQEYTLTAASHDPDGTAHEWLEEALRFTVVDDRPTAGVANLNAEVRFR